MSDGFWNVDSAAESPALTPELLADAADSIFRNFGPYGCHSKRCVYLSDERDITRWCCADDCEIGRRDA